MKKSELRVLIQEQIKKLKKGILDSYDLGDELTEDLVNELTTKYPGILYDTIPCISLKGKDKIKCIIELIGESFEDNGDGYESENEWIKYEFKDDYFDLINLDGKEYIIQANPYQDHIRIWNVIKK